MIGFPAIAWADGGADPCDGVGQTMTSGASGLYPSDECGRSVLYNKAWERPRDRVPRGSLSVSSVIWP